MPNIPEDLSLLTLSWTIRFHTTTEHSWWWKETLAEELGGRGGGWLRLEEVHDSILGRDNPQLLH